LFQHEKMSHPADPKAKHLEILQELVDEAKIFFSSRIIVGDKPQLVVLDIDGTALDDSSRMVDVPQFYAPFQPILDLYEFLLDHEYHIVFLTGRQEAHRDTTQKNLKHVGYGRYDSLLMVPDDGYSRLGVPEIGNWKDLQRCQLKEIHNYHLVACVGDQDMDTRGEHIGEYQLRLPPPPFFQNCIIQ